MARFQFRLAPVLRLREHCKEEKEFALRTLHGDRASLEREIAGMEESLDRVGEEFQAERLFTAVEFQLQEDYAGDLERTIAKRHGALAELDQRIAQKRQELTEAARAVKSLELLRQRQEEKFRRQQNADEQKFTDEVGQRQFIRRRGRQ